MTRARSTPRLHMHDGAVLEFMPAGRGPWRRGVVRELPEGRWVIEEIGRGQQFVLDDQLQFRTTDKTPIHPLTWVEGTGAVA